MDCLDCLDCSICYDAINATTGVATLSCSHSFHISCIAGWFAKLEKGSCPCCRKEMSALEDLPKPVGEEEDEEEEDQMAPDDRSESIIERLEKGVLYLNELIFLEERAENPRKDYIEETREELKDVIRGLLLEKGVIEWSSRPEDAE
jgi:hypothetical protein